MILYCRKCGQVWEYSGTAEKETSCPGCKGYIHLQNNLVPEVLGDTGDYSGAILLGVSEENSIIYRDDHYGFVVEFYGEPDPYSRSEETQLSPS